MSKRNDLWCKDTLWECSEVESGHWVAICKELNLTLQDNSLLMLEEQINDILSCNLIRQAIDASHVHLNIPKHILDKIYEARNSRSTTNSSRV